MESKLPNKTAFPPAALLAPVPVVLVSSAGISEPLRAQNALAIAWAGTVCSEPAMVSISVRPSRHSYAQIMESREFVVNMVGRSLAQAMDFCGVKSGRDMDKLAACGLTSCPVEGLQYAQAIAEAPVSVGCKVKQVIPLGTHDLFLGDITQILVDSALIDAAGKIHMERADLVSYVHGEYYALAEMLGFFGYSVASPEAMARRMSKAGK